MPVTVTSPSRVGVAVADRDVADDVRARVVAVAVAARRVLGWSVGGLESRRSMSVDRLERLVLDEDRARPRGAPARGARPRRARPARRSSGRGRSRARAGRRTRARSASRPGTSSWVSTAWTPGSVTASEMSIATMRACACGLRTVWPQSIPRRDRSLEYANSPVDLGDAVDAARGSRRRGRPRARAWTVVASTRHALRPRGLRTASKIFA